MKIALIIIGLILIAGSFYADYRWKRWMEARKAERDKDNF
jgi:hypothetical protein